MTMTFNRGSALEEKKKTMVAMELKKDAIG